MGLGTAFTVLAVLEAHDKISSVIEKVDAVLDGFSDTTQKAAESAASAGAKIDESLLRTASGADAVELADARLATAQEKLTASTLAQANAEKALLDARASIASEEELATAADALAAAQKRATAAATELASAQETLKVYEKEAVDADLVAAATDRVAAAQERAAGATAELTAAQERQSALVTNEDVIAAANTLTAAERDAAKASTEVTAAQERQTATQRAAVLATDEGAAAAEAQAAAQAKEAEAAKASADANEMASKAMTIGAIAVAAIGYESIKAAGNFESLTEHLVTDAGESQANLKKVQAGILAISVATGTSTTDLANGMYHIESAGYHGAAGLTVLKTAAEGAKVGGADLDTVSRVLVGSMNAYHVAGSGATAMMNEMIATTGAGDMRMEDLASSLSAVTPVAAAAHISFAQVGGAIATMTAQGMTAQQATQDLAHSISSLQNPNSVQVKEMQALGINVNDLSTKMGARGLTGTYNVLIKAITAQMGPAGTVMLSAFNNSTQAAANANVMIKAMPSSLQTLAKAYMAGSITQSQWTADLKGLPPIQAAAMRQFGTLADKTKQFSSQLTSGSPAAQTFTAALSKATGGTTGLKTALMLTGQHAATFAGNVQTVADAATKGGKDVDNWSKIQGTFNQKMAVAKAAVEAAGVSIGTVLLPVVSKIAGYVVDIIGPMATWIAKNQSLMKTILEFVGPIVLLLGAFLAAVKVIGFVEDAFTALKIVMMENPWVLLAIAVIAIAILIYKNWGAISKFLEGIWRWIAKTAESIWNPIAKFFEGLWKDISGIFNDAVSAVVGIIENWYPLILGVLSGGILLIPALIFKYWSQISGFFSRVGKDVLSALTEAWDAVTKVTSTVWNAILGFFKKWWPLLFVIFTGPIAVLDALWNHFGDAILSAAQATWNAIAGFFVTIWDAITSAAQVAWNAVASFFDGLWHGISAVAKAAWDGITAVLGAVWSGIKSIASAVWEDVKLSIIDPVEIVWSYLQTVAHSMMSLLESAWRSIESVASSIWHAIESAIVSPLESAWHTVTSVVSSIASSIWSGLMSAWHAVENIGSWFLSIGSDIVNGIISGVENAGAALMNTLGNLASDALDAAKSFLGIGSPSKLFRDEVGQWIPHGIAEGVTAYASVAQKAVSDLSDSLTGTAHTAVTGSLSLAGSGLTALGSGGGGSSGGLVLQIDLRGATIANQQAMNQLADSMGKAVVKKLAQAGVHIKS
jgi:phage-related protein